MAVALVLSEGFQKLHSSPGAPLLFRLPSSRLSVSVRRACHLVFADQRCMQFQCTEPDDSLRVAIVKLLQHLTLNRTHYILVARRSPHHKQATMSSSHGQMTAESMDESCESEPDSSGFAPTQTTILSDNFLQDMCGYKLRNEKASKPSVLARRTAKTNIRWPELQG